MPAAKNFLVGFFILPFCNFFAVTYAEEVDSYFAWKIKNPDDTPDEKLNLINQARVYCGLGELDKYFEIVEKIYPQMQENFGETDFENAFVNVDRRRSFFMLGNTKTSEKFLQDAKSTKIFNTSCGI